MGIDVFAQWRGQSKEERDSQMSAWLSPTAGSCGYLREAYHGTPYATRFLCAEAFAHGAANISAAILRERLPQTLRLVEERERKLYGSDEKEIEAVKQSYRDFVALCERMEQDTGEPMRIIASY
jgi:hypothetical protein